MIDERLVALLAGSSLLIAGAAADQITVPNVFQQGTPAIADQVNANFNALVIESNAQDNRIQAVETSQANVIMDRLSPLVIDNTQSPIGTFHGYYDGSLMHAVVMTGSGYNVIVNLLNGKVRRSSLLYASNDCSGQAYAPGAQIVFSADAFDEVSFTSFDSGIRYYVPASSTAESVDMYSAGLPGNCQEIGGPVTMTSVAKAYQNVPAVTGVPATLWGAPLRLER